MDIQIQEESQDLPFSSSNAMTSHSGEPRVPQWNPLEDQEYRINPWTNLIFQPSTEAGSSYNQTSSSSPNECTMMSQNSNSHPPPDVTSQNGESQRPLPILDITSHNEKSPSLPKWNMQSQQYHPRDIPSPQMFTTNCESNQPPIIDHCYAEIPCDSFKFVPHHLHGVQLVDSSKPCLHTLSPSELSQSHYTRTHYTGSCSNSSSQDSSVGYCCHTGSLFSMPRKPSCTAGNIPTTGGVPARNCETSKKQHDYQELGKVVQLSRKKSMLWNVLLVALVGIVYVAIGVVGGYYMGQTYCTEECVAPPVSYHNSSTDPVHTSVTAPSVTRAISSSLHTEGTVTMRPRTLSSGSTVYQGTGSLSTPSPSTDTCRQVSGVCMCGSYGGDLGEFYSDHDPYMLYGNITGFTVRYNSYVMFGVQLSYGGQTGNQHGYTTSGFTTQVSFNSGEVITHLQVDFTRGQSFLTSVYVQTNIRVLGPYGGVGERSYNTSGDRLLYIAGRSGSMVDQLTLYYDKCH